MNKFLKKNSKKKLVVLDIPLLVENKLYKKNYILLYVQADTKEIQSRLKNTTTPLEQEKKISKFYYI